MKRVCILLIALLLVGCGGKQSAPPQIQPDARAESALAPAAAVVTAAPQAATVPETAVAPAATEAPAAPAEASAPAEAGLVDELTARWAAEGLLEGLYPFAPEDFLDYSGIDLGACRGGAAYGDAVGYTNEAVVVEADSAVLDQVEELLTTHLAALKAQFRGYDAEALALAEKAVLVREGDAVLFVISPDAERMLALFRELTA